MMLRYLHLPPDGTPPQLDIQPCKLIIVSDAVASDEWRNEIAKWIYGIGSRYVVAWGLACEEWHDSVDWANLEAFDFGDIPDADRAMTTWHPDEPLSEAFWFAGFCAHHPDLELNETIILHVAEIEDREVLLSEYRASQNSDSDD